MRLKTLGVQGSTSIKAITAVIKSMSLEEAAATVATTGLTEAEKIRLLVNKGLCSTDEEAIEALAMHSAGNVATAGTTDLLSAASLKLKAALKGVWAVIKANPVLVAVSAAVAVVAGVAKGVDYIMTKSDRLSEKLSETKEKISETTETITSLETKLSDAQNRMSELNSMGSLTIAEQQELSNLKEVTAQLERQIELEKARRRIETKQGTEGFVNWFDSDLHTYGEYNYKGQGSAEANQKESNNAVSYNEHKFKWWWNQIGGSTKELDEETYINNRFDYLSELISKRSAETDEDEKKKIDENIDGIFTYLNGKSKEFNSQMEGLELDYVPNAKKGSQEEKINEIIEYVDTFNDKLLLAEAKANGATSDSYNKIFSTAIASSRFKEAVQQIEELKETESGAERTTKQFNKALLNVINSNEYKGSNLEKLINYLKDDLGFEIDISGEDKLMSLSSMFVQVEKKVKDATQSNLLFADSFSKMSAARKAFEEGLQNIETGTEDYESYAESYEKAMELLNKGYDLDNGVLMAHVERLMSDEQLQKLGYDADKVKKFLQDHLKGVFGDKDTNEPGNGLIDKIKKYAGENGKIYAKGKDGKPNKKRELASYKDGKWHISDDSKDIEELGKQFGMTTDEILACVKAMKTFSDVNLNDTDTIINKLKKEGKVYTATTEETDKNGKKKKKSAVNLTQLKADMESSGQYTKKDIYNTIQQLKNDKNIITVEIDAKTKSKKVAEELEELGILSGEKAGVKGHNQYKYRQVDDIDEATKALKKFGLTGQEAYEKLKKINIGDEDGKLLSDVEKIESVIKTFNSDFDIGKFKSINLQGEVPEGGKRTEIVNVIPLKEELEKKGYSSQFIDEYIKGLEQQKHVVTIDTSMEFTQKGDVTTIEDQLVAAGVATKGEDGKYTINVKETVTLLKNTGTDSDDVTTFLNNLKNAAEQDGSLNLNFSSNISSIEGEVQSVYSGVGELGDKVDGTSEKLVNLDNVELGNVTQQVNGLYSELNNSRSQADSLYQKLLTISQGEYEARIKVLTEGGATVSGTANDGKITHRTTGAQAASGTAYAGGNWGTAPGGKTLTGELG